MEEKGKPNDDVSLDARRDASCQTGEGQVMGLPMTTLPLVKVSIYDGASSGAKDDVSHIPSCQTGEVQDTETAWLAWCAPVV